MESLTEISKSQPHAAYVAFTKGFKSKFTYYLRTIESFEEYVNPIEEVIHTSFLPSLFERAQPLHEDLKELVSLSTAQCGIGIPHLKRERLEQFNASLDVTAPHVNSIVTQSSTIPARELMEERKLKVLKGEPLQSPGLTGLTNRYLLIYSKRCSRQGTREPARG